MAWYFVSPANRHYHKFHELGFTRVRGEAQKHRITFLLLLLCCALLPLISMPPHDTSSAPLYTIKLALIRRTIYSPE